MQYPEPLAKLIESYTKLPGIGQKTATRLAFYTLTMQGDDVTNFAKSLLSAKRDLHSCSICGNICQDKTRDRSQILVVEQSQDVMAMERMHEYHGLYHVLNGVISPVAGTGPEDINITSLLDRLKKDDEIKEVIIATNASSDGELTASYLAKLIKPAGIKVTRLAHGLSVGADIDYADEVTLFKAVQGRTEM